MTKELELIRYITEQIEALMQIRGINKTELAKRLQVSKSHVSRLLSGERNMRISTMNRIADALGVRLIVEFREKNMVESENGSVTQSAE